MSDLITLYNEKVIHKVQPGGFAFDTYKQQPCVVRGVVPSDPGYVSVNYSSSLWGQTETVHVENLLRMYKDPSDAKFVITSGDLSANRPDVDIDLTSAQHAFDRLTATYGRRSPSAEMQARSRIDRRALVPSRPVTIEHIDSENLLEEFRQHSVTRTRNAEGRTFRERHNLTPIHTERMVDALAPVQNSIASIEALAQLINISFPAGYGADLHAYQREILEVLTETTPRRREE